MNRRNIGSVCFAGIGLVSLVGAIAIAAPFSPSDPPAMTPPPGWSEADMQACMEAGTPGKMHEFLAKTAGEWRGKCTMWMYPDAEPMKSDCTSTITTIMDGRYTRSEMSGEMPEMGPFSGLGITGFDNVTKKFVGSWIDNHNTGIMNGVGELSADGKTLTWTYTFNCPIAKKAVTLREVDRFTSDTSMTMEMFGSEPKSGKEFKMMNIEFTRKP